MYSALSRFAIIVAVCPSLGGGALRAAALQAGAAKATVTPDVKATKVYMAGFDNNRVATGVHDDLYVRCLALARRPRRRWPCARRT